MTQTTFITKVLAVLGALVLLHCGKGDVAGGAGSETNSGLTALVVDAQGNPQSKASYRLRPTWYYRVDSAHTAMRVLPMTQWADGICGVNGRCTLPVLDSGTYVLELRSGLMGQRIQVKMDSRDTTMQELGTLVLAPLGQVSGVVRLSNAEPAWVKVYGTEELVSTDSMGRFQKLTLIQGPQTLRAEDRGNARILGEMHLQVKSGEALELDTLNHSSDILDVSTWASSTILSRDAFLQDSSLDAIWTPLVVPMLLPLGPDLVDFAQAAPDGSDLRLVDSSGAMLPMDIRYWDPVARRAMVWVRLPAAYMAGAGGPVRLLSGKRGAVAAWDAAGVWAGWSSTLRDSLLTIPIDDFEDGDSYLSTPTYLGQKEWYGGADTMALQLLPAWNMPFDQAVEKDATGRTGWNVHVRYTAPLTSWVLVGSRITGGPRDLRGIDSVVFWARGNGAILLALENGTAKRPTKAWAERILTATWTRYSIRPQAFDAPGIGDNIGWEAVRDSITTLSIFGVRGNEFWLDDISLHGLHPLELR